MEYPKIKRVAIYNGDNFAEIRNSDLIDERISRSEWEAALRDDIREVFGKAPKNVQEYFSEHFIRWINALSKESDAEVGNNGG